MKRIVKIAALSAALVFVFSFAGMGTARADGSLDAQFYLEEHQKSAEVAPIFGVKAIEKETKMAPQEYRVLKAWTGELTREQLDEMVRAAGAGS